MKEAVSVRRKKIKTVLMRRKGVTLLVGDELIVQPVQVVIELVQVFVSVRHGN